MARHRDAVSQADAAAHFRPPRPAGHGRGSGCIPRGRSQLCRLRRHEVAIVAGGAGGARTVHPAEVQRPLRRERQRLFARVRFRLGHRQGAFIAALGRFPCGALPDGSREDRGSL